MTLGSLFDGSGGFPLAGALCGITPVWASEIEPYPVAVTRSRFPGMRHLGNVAEIHGDRIPPVDVITFGSPCQDMSVAGKRAGMKHEGKGDDATTRSGLFYEAIRIIQEMREATHEKYPAFAIWENVPGAFSSNKGEDFRCVLEEFAKIGEGGCSIPRPAGGKWNHAGEIVGDGFSVAWRTLDAQYWGVPQRRKRIYLVADFAGGRAGEILFERESVRGDTAPSGAPWKETAADATGSAGGSNCLRCLNPWDCQSKRIYQPEGIYPTLPAMDCGGANNQAVIYSLQGNGIDRADTAGCNGCGWREDVCYTLNTIDRPAICFKVGQGAKARSMGESEKVAPTLGSEAGGNSVPAVCYPKVFHSLTAANAGNVESAQQPNCVCYPQVARTLTAEADASPCIDRGQNVVCYDARGNGDGEHAPTLTGDHENRVTDYTAVAVYRHQKIGEYAADGTASTMAARDFKSPRDLVVERSKPPRKYIIRRLTPLECCRLQGFPDGWGVPDYKENMTDEELAFWQKVRDTHATVNGKPTKAYTAAAMIKWYNGLHTDSAEYKMWGNGIALPCAKYVLQGISEVRQ